MATQHKRRQRNLRAKPKAKRPKAKPAPKFTDLGSTVAGITQPKKRRRP